MKLKITKFNYMLFFKENKKLFFYFIVDLIFFMYISVFVLIMSLISVKLNLSIETSSSIWILGLILVLFLKYLKDKNAKNSNC